jgi:hypothetical protein
MGAASSAFGQPASNSQLQSKGATEMTPHPYVGMWVTKDGHIRQELLPSGRYDEARGTRRSAYQGRYEVRGNKSAYQGRYEVRGNKIAYWDDTGFTADGEFIGGVLHHGGMLFYREEQVNRRP